MKSWDALKTLMGGYLHEDFAYLYGSAWGAVDAFARDEPDYPPQLRREITEVLTTYHSEVDLETALVDLGLMYLPSAEGWDSHRAWLCAVAERVEDTLRKSSVA